MITPREAARLQGFPEDYILPKENEKQVYKQIGNSVAVPVVSKIAKNIYETLEEFNSNIKGVFKILSTEYEFKLDITKNNIEFNELNITELESPSLKFNIQPLEKDYIKKIEISNIEFNEIHKIVSQP